MTDSKAKALNTVMMAFAGIAFSTFTIMMGILSSRESKNTELLHNMNVFIERRAIISDDAISNNNKAHNVYDVELEEHEKRITYIEKQNSIINTKLNLETSYNQKQNQ